MESYFDFFRRVCESRDPFPYQLRFHEEQAACRVLKVPTGLGKTDTVLVDWLRRRPTTRLVYCLPGRALTTQVANVARERASRVDGSIRVVELMGGSENLDLKLGPDEPAILVGTQDILISRALNRGYARSPFRWPIDFALLNNDAVWVYDEVQLLGDALATSTQLAAFRKKLVTFGDVPSVWMSATFDEAWLNTVDFKENPAIITLEREDREIETVSKRVQARKTIKAADNCEAPKGCAQFVRQQHRDGMLTLVIANTVLRAQEIWDELKRAGMNDGYLLHSRFRPCDRSEIVDEVFSQKRGIVVSTQVIEAGVDLDADLMVTDVAPWPSLVQRFGRVNRYGEKDGAQIFWVDQPLRGKSRLKDEEIVRPYDLGEVNTARECLRAIESAAPADLPAAEQSAPYKFVLRRSDLLDLFDTTPDLAGNHIDVSRFVRSGEETNVYAAWREWQGEWPDRQRISQQELCAIPRTAELEAFVKKHGAWTWNFTGRGSWEKVDPKRLYPGIRILFRSEAGGYDPEKGWAPASTSAVPERRAGKEQEESNDDDPVSEGRRQRLDEHTDEVVAELEELLRTLRVSLSAHQDVLLMAARYHDWGKAHKIFQETLHGMIPLNSPPDEILAKSEGGNGRHSRKWFRHELASALAMIGAGLPDLATYIVAAHHGKVRVNIRSMPGEKTGRARGVDDGDELFPAPLGGDALVPRVVLKLDVTKLGMNGASFRGWSDRVLELIDDLGPFRLAYLETLLRVADERASAKAQEVKK